MTVMNHPNGPSRKTTIKHRNSNASPPHLGIIISSTTTTTTKTTISKRIDDDDVELISFASLSYTSLKDLMPSSAQQPFNPSSPIASTYAQFGLEIPIRNHLVKQAAWAYLQPMSNSPSSSAPFSLRRLLRVPVTSCLCFFRRKVLPAASKAFHWLLKAITGKSKFL